MAILLWKRENLIKDVVETVGVSPQAVSGWIKKYKAGGLASLKARKPGPVTGQIWRLTPRQEKELQRLITEKSPDQPKLSYALWTRKVVMELIQQQTGIEMPIRTVGNISSAEDSLPRIRWGL